MPSDPFASAGAFDSVLAEEPSIEEYVAGTIASPSARIDDRKPPGRRFGDSDATRKAIYDSVYKVVSGIAPVSEHGRTLSLTGVDWMDPDYYPKKRQKRAILFGETLGRRLRGTWTLTDDATGKPIESRSTIVARVPFMTNRGTFINNGSEYTLNHQQRLVPGVYTRIKKNDEIEAHVNAPPGKGVSHRYIIDPEKGVFKLALQQAEIPLYPILRALGADDQRIKKAIGEELLIRNRDLAEGKDERTLKKLAERMLSWKAKQDVDRPLGERLREAFEAVELDPYVTERTLGKPYVRMDADAILASMQKVLRVAKRETDPDNRDSPAFQTFLGPEELFSERVAKDSGRLQRHVFRQALREGTLRRVPTGLFTKQLDTALLSSGLGQAIEEVNPLEIYDKQFRVTRLGEGGIGSLQAIPTESRNVLPSHIGLLDPVRTPESLRAGVDLQIAAASRKTEDGKMVTRYRDAATGKTRWLSARDVRDQPIVTEEILNAYDTPYVPAIVGDKHEYVSRDKIRLVVDDFERAFTPLSNLIPFKSTSHAQRLSMGSRMTTQALPVRDAQSPLVRMVDRETSKNFARLYADKAGGEFADKPGRVLSVDDDEMVVQYADGEKKTIDLYSAFPFNRKTFFTQKPKLKPGDSFEEGDNLVTSNYTDKDGLIASGLNMRTAYLPWRGYNFEDAVVISESAAKRLTSQHMYQHAIENDPRTRIGRNEFLQVFPGKFDKKVLDRFGAEGLPKPGQVLEYGDPVILAIRENEYADNKVHRKGDKGFADATVTWDHHDKGVVRDAVMTPKGPIVTVESESRMNVGDKVSGVFGDKGVVSAIVPDADMPHGPDGNPFELLLNPNGLTSRRNAGQKAELWLSKIAALTGKPYELSDFHDIPDVMAYVDGELKKHGLSGREDIVDPTTGRTIPKIATGVRYVLKLHHQAEGKAQGRSSGAYTSEGIPAKGGETGCFAGDTELLVRFNGVVQRKPIRDVIVMLDTSTPIEVAGADEKGERIWERPSDWFEFDASPQEMCIVRLSDGSAIRCTWDHRFYTATGEQIEARNLTPDVELLRVSVD